MAILFAGSAAFAGGPAAPAPPVVTIGTVSGTFYPNPSDSGAFDSSQLSSPSFSESFPVIDFNPPASAQVACSNSTGVDENSRPLIDVIPNSDGTCSTQVAGGNGLQAGVGSLSSFQAVYLSSLTISTPGQVTFNFFSDDGWILGVGSQIDGSSAQPTYVSGELSSPPPVSPVKGYPVVGALNGPSAPTQAQVTVNFPAAGTYPIEVDYTECCGGQLALTLGTTAGNPIPPSSCITTTAAQPGDLSAQATSLAGKVGRHFDSSTVLATFTDPADGTRLASASDFTASIDWGDGYFCAAPASIVNSAGMFEVHPSVPHTFCRAGTYSYTVVIRDTVDQELAVTSGQVREKADSHSLAQCAFGELLLSTGSTVQSLNRSVHACSGTMVDSASGLMVVTAAHCLDFASDGSVADHIAAFIPAVYKPLGTPQPFGIWISRNIYADPLYSNGSNTTFDATYDYAYIRLDPSSCFVGGQGQCPIPSSSVAQFLGGGVPIHWNPPRGNGYLIYDPGAAPSSCDPSFSNNESLGGSGPDLMVEECNMSDNAGTQVPVSGSPWLDGSDGIVSVTSKAGFFSYLPNPFSRQSLWGTYLGDHAKADFESDGS